MCVFFACKKEVESMQMMGMDENKCMIMRTFLPSVSEFKYDYDEMK
jgi:hypothetical protein